MRTLVVAAYPPELAQLVTRAGVIGRAVGIGLVAASAGAERAIWEEQPSRLMVVGTAGALPGSQLAIGSVVVVVQARLGVRPGEYLPPMLQSAINGDDALSRQCAEALDAPMVSAVCPIGITSSDAEAERLGKSGAAVEHLETFAIFAAAARAGVPATALLAIANHVGANAAAEWRANRVAAESAALQALSRLL